MQGERRVLTILFCDVTGSTALAEQLDPEEWAEIMNAAFKFMIDPVLRYEGTLSRLLGDAILAFFGAPIAHEDDPQRAVMAALGIISGLQPFRQEFKRDYGLDFNLRIGLHTGPVVVGEIGAGISTEYTAMGDAVNLAARMEQTAAPGTIQISEDTYRLVAPLFDCESLGTVVVKGKRKPVPVYRVLGLKATPGRTRGLSWRPSPFTGRQAELARLRSALDGLEAGRGALVFLTGEAGLGKSRLIEEICQESQSRPNRSPPAWVESRGVSYDTQRPYSLFLQLLRHSCGVGENDTPDVARIKILNAFNIAGEMVEAGLEPGAENGGKAAMRRAVEMILSVDAQQPQNPGLEGETLKREIFNAVALIVRQTVSQSPLVIVVDDMHWVDPASTELLERTFELAGELPLLYLFALRPYTGSPGWKARQKAASEYGELFQEIMLQPLTLEETDSLIENLLASPAMPAGLRQALLQKAEGNPLFAEELVREFTEDGLAPAGYLSLPDNLLSLLTARIDRLNPDARRVLQLAAVIGRSFDAGVLAQVAGEGASLQDRLDILEEMGLIHPSDGDRASEFSFQHELLREAAYESILHRQRRRYHRQVGEALEASHPPRLEEVAHRLAYHFQEGRDFERALKYASLAGEAAARLFANAEAAVFYAQAITLARSLPAENVPAGQLADLYLRRGRVLELCGQFDDAMENYRELEALAAERGSPSFELAALTSQAILHAIPSSSFNQEHGRQIAARSLDLVQQVRDPALEARALWTLVLLESRVSGDLVQAVRYGRQSEAIARRHKLKEQLAYTLHDLSRIFMESGQVEAAFDAHEEAKSLWRELGNAAMLADCLVAGAQGLYLMGEYARAIELAEEGLQVSRRAGSLWGQAYAYMVLAPQYLETGQIGKSMDAFDQAYTYGGQANFLAPVYTARVLQAWVYTIFGDTNQGLEIMDQVAHDSRSRIAAEGYIPAVYSILYLYAGDLARVDELLAGLSGDPHHPQSDVYFGPLFLYFQGELAYRKGKPEEALSVARIGLEQRRQARARLFLVDYYELQGRALLALGRLEEAHRSFELARQECASTGSRRMLWQVLEGQAETAVQLGQTGAARALRQEAAAEIQQLAGSMSADLRQSFLRMPAVQTLLAAARG